MLHLHYHYSLYYTIRVINMLLYRYLSLYHYTITIISFYAVCFRGRLCYKWNYSRKWSIIPRPGVRESLQVAGSVLLGRFRNCSVADLGTRTNFTWNLGDGTCVKLYSYIFDFLRNFNIYFIIVTGFADFAPQIISKTPS